MIKGYVEMLGYISSDKIQCEKRRLCSGTHSRNTYLPPLEMPCYVLDLGGMGDEVGEDSRDLVDGRAVRVFHRITFRSLCVAIAVCGLLV